jgi:benzoyl-CoA-dihydrodiol lyase
VKGKRAVGWKLVDAVYPTSQFDAAVRKRAGELAARRVGSTARGHPPRTAEPDRDRGLDHLLGRRADVQSGEADRRTDRAAPTGPQPSNSEEIVKAGDQFWPLRAFRELDDALLRLRLNEPRSARS